MMDRHFFPNAPPQTFIQTNDPYSSSALLTSMSNDAFALRELIGKLGATCSYDSGPHLQPAPILPHATDPGFAERAAKFSCFGSKSFNERRPPTTPPPLIGHNRSGSSKLPRVSSTPVLKVGVENKFTKFSGSAPANSNDEVELESSVSEQISNEMVSSRKRKGKSKQDDGEDEDVNAKRTKLTAQSGKNGNSGAKMEDEPKPADPPKDYIHVRARRGQATDSHSLAERVRREKISERMKLLQDLVPGCNKVTGKALMLDEIINYVQSLQRQVEFLSMKLASVNPELEADHFNMDNLLTKDMLQQNGNVSQQMYPLDSSMYNHNHHQSHQNVQQHQLHTSTGPILDHVVPLDVPLCRNLGIHMPSIDGFSAAGLPEFPAFGEDDLQSIVQMGFVQNPINFPVAYQTSNMKVEL